MASPPIYWFNFIEIYCFIEVKSIFFKYKIIGGPSFFH